MDSPFCGSYDDAGLSTSRWSDTKPPGDQWRTAERWRYDLRRQIESRRAGFGVLGDVHAAATSVSPSRWYVPSIDVRDDADAISTGMRPTIRTTDLSGAPVRSLLSTLSRATATTSTTILVAPAYVVDELSWNAGCLTQLFGRTFGVHADFDDLGGVIGARWDRMGVGIWRVDGPSCDFDNVD